MDFLGDSHPRLYQSVRAWIFTSTTLAQVYIWGVYYLRNPKKSYELPQPLGRVTPSLYLSVPPSPPSTRTSLDSLGGIQPSRSIKKKVQGKRNCRCMLLFPLLELSSLIQCFYWTRMLLRSSQCTQNHVSNPFAWTLSVPSTEKAALPFYCSLSICTFQQGEN